MSSPGTNPRLLVRSEPEDAAPRYTGRRGQPTIDDVARMAGVSKKTVSRVLNEPLTVGLSTRERVEDVIERCAYVPDPGARSLGFSRLNRRTSPR